MKKHAVILAALAVAVGAFTVTIPGTAEAQSGSRICGNYWEARANGKTVGVLAKVYEVPKSPNGGICDIAIGKADHVQGEQLPGFNGNVAWNPRQAIREWTCEDFGDLLNDQHGNDPCNSMNRIDFYTEFETTGADGNRTGRAPSKFSIVY